MERRENLPDTYRCRACGSGTLPPILFVRCRQALEPCPSGNEDLQCWLDSGRLEKISPSPDRSPIAERREGDGSRSTQPPLRPRVFCLHKRRGSSHTDKDNLIRTSIGERRWNHPRD